MNFLQNNPLNLPQEDEEAKVGSQNPPRLPPPHKPLNYQDSLEFHTNNNEVIKLDLESPEDRQANSEFLDLSHDSAGSDARLRASLDASSTNIWWILRRLEEMGLAAHPHVVTRTIKAYPIETSKDFILEAILQNMFERDSNDSQSQIEEVFEQEDANHGRRMSQYRKLLQEINNLLLGEADSYQQENFCQLCSKLIIGEPESLRLFECSHMLCRGCLLEIFQTRIQNNEDVEKFQCPYFVCNSRIIIDKFVKMMPEADYKDLGETEGDSCGICFDTVKGSETLLKVFACDDHYYCYSCTLTYFKEHINHLEILSIKCPNFECQTQINEEKLKQLLPAYLFHRYLKLKKNALIERDPNIKWCTRPGCENYLHGNKEQPKVSCPCGQTICFICGNDWHELKTCEQALEEEYKHYAKDKGLQFCPECKSRVEKQAGCNHMTCPICTYEWCWLCRGEYSPGHFDPLNPLGCPGLMSGAHTRRDWGRWKIYLRRFLLFILFLFVLALSPIWIVGGAILVPNLVYEGRNIQTTYMMVVIRFFLGIVGLILMPLTIVCGFIAAIVPGSCILTIQVVKMVRRRITAKKTRKQLIKSREERLKKNETSTVIAQSRDIMIDFGNQQDFQRSSLTRPLLQKERYLSPLQGDLSIDIE